MATTTIDRMKEHIARDKRTTFTIEAGRGSTYRSNAPTLYAHSTYERGSVLAGAPMRTWMDTFDTWDSARTFASEAGKTIPRLKLEIIDGSTFIPSETLCDMAGLPHDEDY